jgi:Sigma-70, region 4
MNLRTPKVFARHSGQAEQARSRASEHNQRFQNSLTALNPLLPSVKTFCNPATTPQRGQQSVGRSDYCKRRVTVDTAVFVPCCFPTTITIPAPLRYRPLEALSGNYRLSARLTHVLHRSGVRVLGDLNGRRVGDFARKRNCGLKTLQELDSLSWRVQSWPKKASISADARGSRRPVGDARASHSEAATASGFVIPESVGELRFDELPISKHLANVARSIGLRTLADLARHSPFKLLQCKACGWRTLAEIQQLIERAICGEFDVDRIDISNAVAELLILLEQGLTKLAPRDRKFLIARIRGMTFAEIGRRYGLTRARTHQAVVKALRTLRNAWGPRIPRLLETLKLRCLSIPKGSGLTPARLEQWVGDSSKSFRLSREAQLRLIAALDKSIPCSLD